MLFKRDFSSEQFNEIQGLYDKASQSLKDLKENHSEFKNIWNNVDAKMKTIKESIDSDSIPSDEKKQQAAMRVMLMSEFKDSPIAAKLRPLYDLDSAYALLGVKEITFRRGKRP